MNVNTQHSGALYSVDADSGAEKWNFTTSSKHNSSSFGFYSDPVLSPDGSIVFVNGWDNNFYAVETSKLCLEH